MNVSIVLTVLGDDNPGIVESLSDVLVKHGGNWTQSSMSALAGKFAGILLARVPVERADECIAALHALDRKGLDVVAQRSDEPAETGEQETVTLDLVGYDHPGIVHDITHVLAVRHVNVLELETTTESASMGGGTLFRARAQLLVPDAVNLHDLETELENLANELMVEVRLTD